MTPYAGPPAWSPWMTIPVDLGLSGCLGYGISGLKPGKSQRNRNKLVPYWLQYSHSLSCANGPRQIKCIKLDVLAGMTPAKWQLTFQVFYKKKKNED